MSATARGNARLAAWPGLPPRPCPPHVAKNMSWGESLLCTGQYDLRQVGPQVEFLLDLRGDTPSSRKLYDAIEVGAIPLVVSDMRRIVGLPFQCFVPFHLFTTQVKERSLLTNVSEALGHVLDTLSAPIRNRMREVMALYARDVLWRHPESRVAENCLLQVRELRLPTASRTCWFQNRQRKPDVTFPHWLPTALDRELHGTPNRSTRF